MPFSIAGHSTAARVKRAMFVLVLVLAFAGGSAAAPVVANGDFEAGSQGWSQLGPVVCDAGCLPPQGHGPATGARWAWLGGDLPNAWVSQTVTVPPGHFLKLARDKFDCVTGAFAVRFINGGTTTVLLNESTASGAAGCGAGYQEELIDVRPLAGQTGTLQLRYAGGTPEASASVFVDDVAFVPAAVKGDFNGDRKADLLLVRSDDPICDFHDIWYMSEAQRTGVGHIVTLCDADQKKIEAADDFDGDGKTDVVTHRHTDGQATVIFHDGTTMIGMQNIGGAAPLPAAWELASTGDFNGDGSPDIVWRNTLTQKLLIWTLAGTQVTGTIVPNPDQAVDANWRIVGTLDFDGDGARDFLWYNPNSGKIVFWFMDASVQRVTGRFANPPNAGDNNWKVAATGDYGVGPGGLADTADIVWQNETSGNIVVWYMDRAGNRTSGTFTTPTAPSPALAWSVVGPR